MQRCGFYAGNETLQACGNALKVSRERIRQIEAVALGKLIKLIKSGDYDECDFFWAGDNVVDDVKSVSPKNKKYARKKLAPIAYFSNDDLIEKIKSFDVAKFCLVNNSVISSHLWSI